MRVRRFGRVASARGGDTSWVDSVNLMFPGKRANGKRLQRHPQPALGRVRCSPVIANTTRSSTNFGSLGKLLEDQRPSADIPTEAAGNYPGLRSGRHRQEVSKMPAQQTGETDKEARFNEAECHEAVGGSLLARLRSGDGMWPNRVARR